MSGRPLPFAFKTTLFVWCQQATVSNLDERSVSFASFFGDKRLARDLVRLLAPDNWFFLLYMPVAKHVRTLVLGLSLSREVFNHKEGPT